MTTKDPIVEEVRKARDAYAAQFDYDLKRIFADIKQKEKLHAARIVKLAPRKPREVAK